MNLSTVATATKPEPPAAPNASDAPPKKPRGFAAMSVEERRALARKGGKRVHELGRAHVFDSDTASAAGRVAHARGTAYRPPKKGERATHASPSIANEATPGPQDGLAQVAPEHVSQRTSSTP